LLLLLLSPLFWLLLSAFVWFFDFVLFLLLVAFVAFVVEVLAAPHPHPHFHPTYILVHHPGQQSVSRVNSYRWN